MATSGDCPGSESQGREEPVEHCEQHLPEGVHPEEFVAIADYSATDETQLSFLRGEKILILRQTTADWWWGERAGYCGRSLCLAGGHTLLCGPTTNARAAPPVTARVCPLEVAVFPGVHSAVHSAHLWTGWGTVLLS
uniref:Protein arginine methyltransferase 2 n=1 Tax=Myotis myotis TaxID=51298 RepID=A0A7J8A0T3_MYOMY|nr:protein arginine methyltransferase 2 [Myotis myotis]